jgi:hypothetical protein
MKILATACCLALAVAVPAIAAEKKGEAKKAEKPARKKPVKLEKLACRLGTEDEHARIAVLLGDGKVESFAYYSKWKPRTCSMDIKRDDAFSKWVDTGNTTVVTLIEDKGAFLIDHNPGRYHFIFRDIDRMRFCGMEGKVNGTLTIFKGKPQCEVSGVMDREREELPTPVAKPDVKPEEKPQVQPEPKPAEAAKPVATEVKPEVKPTEAPKPEIKPVEPPKPEIKPAETPKPEVKPAESPTPAAQPETKAPPLMEPRLQPAEKPAAAPAPPPAAKDPVKPN